MREMGENEEEIKKRKKERMEGELNWRRQKEGKEVVGGD